MRKKIKMNSDNFALNPLSELNNFINAIYEEKKPYLISAKFIKVECDTTIIEVNNSKFRIHKRNYTFLPGILNPGDIVNVDSRNLY